MRKLITVNAFLMLGLIVIMLLDEIFLAQYMAAPIDSASEALWLSILNTTTIIKGVSLIVMFIINTILYAKRKELI